MGAVDQFKDELKEVGHAVREARKARGLSQEGLAELAGFQRNYIGRIERGERNPNVTTLVMLSRALGISPAQLLERLT